MVSPRQHLWWCNILHLLNDGYLASMALLLPFIATDLNLDLAESGLLKSAISVAISVTQIPGGMLAERIGEVLALGLGSFWFGACYVFMLAAASYPIALSLSVAAGVGGGVYHPVGTGLIASISSAEESGRAIGMLNFFGDVGKVVFPALAGVLVAAMGWRASFAVQGAIGVAATLLYLTLFRREIHQRWQRPEPLPVASDGSSTTVRWLERWGIKDPVQFGLYAAIGSVDAGVRAAAMAFLGFLLLDTGSGESELGWLVSLTFLGGAAGKLLCGLPMRKYGPKCIVLVTEGLMIAGFLCLPSLTPGWGLLVFLPLFGFVLNGTSSVIYIGLAPTFVSQRHSRGYALYYTLNFVAIALAPMGFGLFGDAFGLAALFYVAAAVMAMGLPLAVFLRNVKG